MKNFESSNPVANKLLEGSSASTDSTFTIKGVTNKLFALLGIVLISAMFTWSYVASNPGSISGILIGSALTGLFLVIISMFARKFIMPIATAFSVVEGLFLGAVSYSFETNYPGIGFQAAFVTIGIFIGMMLMYGYRIIPVTDKLRKTIIGLTIGVFIVYLISFIGSLAFNAPIPMIHESGTVGIIFSLFVVGLAAFNLLLDFDFIEKAEQMRLDKNEEWYGAFTLLITIVWLYIEVLKLIAKLRD